MIPDSLMRGEKKNNNNNFKTNSVQKYSRESCQNVQSMVARMTVISVYNEAQTTNYLNIREQQREITFHCSDTGKRK